MSKFVADHWVEGNIFQHVYNGKCSRGFYKLVDYSPESQSFDMIFFYDGMIGKPQYKGYGFVDRHMFRLAKPMAQILYSKLTTSSKFDILSL